MQARHLSEEFIKQAKLRLQKKEQELNKELELLNSEDPYTQEGRADDNSEMLEEAMNEDLVKETLDVKIKDTQHSLEQVEKALAKIEEGTYGICEITGNPIDIARLEAYPEATTEVDA